MADNTFNRVQTTRNAKYKSP